eukprot:764987-Hanusia_phi.AAC.14
MGEADPNQSPFMQEFFDKVLFQTSPASPCESCADISSQKKHGPDSEEHGTHGKAARDGSHVCFKHGIKQETGVERTWHGIKLIDDDKQEEIEGLMDQTSTLITAVKVALKDMDKDSKAHAAKVVHSDCTCMSDFEVVGRKGWTVVMAIFSSNNFFKNVLLRLQRMPWQTYRTNTKTSFVWNRSSTMLSFVGFDMALQGEMLDQIEYSVQQAHQYVDRGVKQLEKAKESQKKSRKRMCCLLCCFIIILFVVIGVVFGGLKGAKIV